MLGSRRTIQCVASFLTIILAGTAARAVDRMHEHRTSGAEPGYRFERGGWTYVHLQGSPEDIGYQHGYLLSAEIEDNYKVLKLESEHAQRVQGKQARQQDATQRGSGQAPEHHEKQSSVEPVQHHVGAVKAVGGRAKNLGIEGQRQPR